MRRLAAVLLFLALLPDPAAARPAEVSRGSAFALPVAMREAGSDAVLAQRVIDRSWGASDDSIYVEVEVPHWRSEGTALALSALVPGTGQLYAGERTGLLFLGGEALGWFEWWYMRHRGEKIRGDARVFAGDPNDSLSRWTFGNYEQRTGLSTDELRQLYASDRTTGTRPAGGTTTWVTTPSTASASWRSARTRRPTSSARATSRRRSGPITCSPRCTRSGRHGCATWSSPRPCGSGSAPASAAAIRRWPP